MTVLSLFLWLKRHEIKAELSDKMASHNGICIEKMWQGCLSVAQSPRLIGESSYEYALKMSARPEII